ncbi:MAG TPA: hypothetical protein VK878_23300 [Candidatus Deferrimicrobiaceae bacterium]|nr:hypothetical protein [Candidatus Deferrimicrobiaceae bacterium]
MIFWTTWVFGLMVGAVCLAAALDCRPRQWFYLAGAYFSMASGVIMSMLAVPL